MSNDVDEWAHELRCELEKASAEGRTTITLTAPVAALSTMATIVQGYFRDSSRTCMLCSAIRTSNALAERLKDFGSNYRPKGSRR